MVPSKTERLTRNDWLICGTSSFMMGSAWSSWIMVWPQTMLSASAVPVENREQND
jgi:hypothetical protein